MTQSQANPIVFGVNPEDELILIGHVTMPEQGSNERPYITKLSPAEFKAARDKGIIPDSYEYWRLTDGYITDPVDSYDEASDLWYEVGQNNIKHFQQIVEKQLQLTSLDNVKDNLKRLQDSDGVSPSVSVAIDVFLRDH